MIESDRGFAYQKEFVPIREQINTLINCLDSYLATRGTVSLKEAMCDYFLAENPLYRLVRFYKLGCGGLSLGYDGRNIKASSLVDFFTSKAGEWGQIRFIDQFINQLKVLSLFEEGGLMRVNQEISTLLSQFQSHLIYSDVNQIKNVSDKLNLILRSAIYLFPHIVNAVEVLVRANSSLEEWLEKNLGDANRNLYSIFCSLLNTKCSYNEVALYFPFPYTNLVPGLSHRLPSCVDRESIVFGSFYSKVDLDRWFRAICLSFSPDQSLGRRSIFLAREVEGIYLKWVDEFSPYCVFDKKIGRYSIVKRPDPIEYYLSFRGFQKFRYLPFSGMNLYESERKFMDLYLIPDNISGLFKLTSEGSLKIINSLFLARLDKSRRNFILYEIPRENVKLPLREDRSDLDINTNKELQALGLCSLIEASNSGIRCKGKSNSLHYLRYEGREIFERLAQIPVDIEGLKLGL